MPDVVMVIAPEVFRDEEYAEPKRVLTERGATVVTASTAPRECIGKLGMKAVAEISVHDAAEQAWDAVVFVGGAGAAAFFDDPDAHRLACAASQSGAVIGAICIAPSILAHADLLGGVRATAFQSQESDLTAHGALWLEGPVVVDGRIVTANGPEAANAFGEALAGLLGV